MSVFGRLAGRCRCTPSLARRVGVGSPCYTSGMTTEQFRSTLHLQPFRPFTIRMADGRALEVAHRYSVLDLLLMSQLQAASGRPA